MQRTRSLILVMIVITILSGFTSAAWTAEKDKVPGKKGRQAQQKATPPKARKAQSATTAEDVKACFGLTPKIEKVMPDEVKPGDRVKITGRDFGSPGCLSSVSFGPGNSAKFVHDSDTLVTATVPQVKKGLVIVTLTTASGEDSKSVLIK